MEVKAELGAFDEEVFGVWESACIESEWTELERPSSTHCVKRRPINRLVKWKSVERESEGNIVPRMMRTTKPCLGKVPCLVQVFGEGKSE